MKWGIQVGLYQGDPILWASDGKITMNPDQARTFSSMEEAVAQATGMRCPWHAINLDDLKDEYSHADE